MRKVYIIIPAFNEQNTILEFLDKIISVNLIDNIL